MQQRGFTLIELLIVVAIIGIISAIAMAVLANALQRSKQSATMSDMRTISNALLAYQIDHNRYPDATTVVDLRPVLVPVFVERLPDQDAWGLEFSYSVDASGDNYTLRSYGKGGVPDASYDRGPVHSFADDITHANGHFIQWPEGAQQ